MKADEVRALLKAKVAEYRDQGQAARHANVSREHLNEVLNGRESPGFRIAKWLGLKRVLTWEPADQ